MLITIFTPTYNRAYILPKLFESLLHQTCYDFEWLIVDDGSTDETNLFIEKIKYHVAANSYFTFRYIKQENGGKHRAINRGLREAKGELFFIVDSDDWLKKDTVEWIVNTFDGIKDDKRFAGLSGIRITPDGIRIGGGTDFGTIDANAIEIREKYFVRGDLAEIYKTAILRQYPFPEFEGERFCPEALIWNRIAQKYKIRYVYKGIYVCDYLPDGLTAKITQIRYRSPQASMMYYSELFSFEKTFKLKLHAAINFWRFAKIRLLHNAELSMPWNVISVFAFPFGIGANIVDIFLKRI